jgi:hypothetical protein
MGKLFAVVIVGTVYSFNKTLPKIAKTSPGAYSGAINFFTKY